MVMKRFHWRIFIIIIAVLNVCNWIATVQFIKVGLNAVNRGESLQPLRAEVNTLTIVAAQERSLHYTQVFAINHGYVPNRGSIYVVTSPTASPLSESRPDEP